MVTYLDYLKNGVNVIAVNEKKQAIFPWKEFQSRMITSEELEKQMSDPRAHGIAIICGGVSGGLEAIDFDLKYDTSDTYRQVLERVPNDILHKIRIHKTKNNGIHWIYRCEQIQGNQKLAQRLPTTEEQKANPSVKAYCIVETRGENGYVVAPPTWGYVVEKNGLQVISIDEREILFSILRSFNEIVEEVHIEAHNRPSAKDYVNSPFEDYNMRGDIRSLFANNGWSVVKENSERIYFLRPGGTSEYSGSYNKSLGLFSVFSVNTPFVVQKGYKPAAVFCILECGGDFKRGARELVNLGYGERRVEIEVKKNDDDILTFWEVNKRGAIEINRYKLQIFLSVENGFKLFFYDASSKIYKLIRVKDGFVEDATSESVKRVIKDYIDGLPDSFDGGITPSALLEVVYKHSSTLFSDSFLEFFDRAEIDFLRDTKDQAFFPFKNGVVCVSKDCVVLKSYGELNKHVYSAQVIDHNIVVDQEDIGVAPIEYLQFLKRICGDNDERLIYVLSLIGYIMHGYKDPAKPYAVILGEETDNEEKGGGTGKGIFVKALSYLSRIVRVDGKNFNLGKSFAFQRVDLDTKIIAIEDVRKRVDFEGFYSIITEGITVEKKNQDEFFIPYKDSPKILFTTNYTITQTGVHAKRRQKIIEFAPYFNNERTPEDEFGHKLFDDWDEHEWNRFFNLFFFAVSDYLGNGVPKVNMSEMMVNKTIRNQFGDDFLEFFHDVKDNKDWQNLDGLHQEFLNLYGMDKKEYSRIRFTKAIKVASELLKVDFELKKHQVERNKMGIKFGTNAENEGEKADQMF